VILKLSYSEDIVWEVLTEANSKLTVRDVRVVGIRGYKGLKFNLKYKFRIKAITNVVSVALTAFLKLKCPLSAVTFQGFNASFLGVA